MLIVPGVVVFNCQTCSNLSPGYFIDDGTFDMRHKAFANFTFSAPWAARTKCLLRLQSAWEQPAQMLPSILEYTMETAQLEPTLDDTFKSISVSANKLSSDSMEPRSLPKARTAIWEGPEPPKLNPKP